MGDTCHGSDGHNRFGHPCGPSSQLASQVAAGLVKKGYDLRDESLPSKNLDLPKIFESGVTLQTPSILAIAISYNWLFLSLD